MRQIYYIGGSPCSGKSTVAEMIAKKYNFQYFKVDDFLEVYISKGAKLGKPLLSKISGMSLDEIWLREPKVQNLEEQDIYNEMFEFILEDLNKLNDEVPIIAEGAAFMPKLMSEFGVGKSNYICIVPTNSFQYKMYSKRPWVMQYLEGCSNKELAFENWMKRDYLFADTVLNDATTLGYPTLVVDGKRMKI